jgi:hypothetical protein
LRNSAYHNTCDSSSVVLFDDRCYRVRNGHYVGILLLHRIWYGNCDGWWDICAPGSLRIRLSTPDSVGFHHLCGRFPESDIGLDTYNRSHNTYEDAGE